MQTTKRKAVLKAIRETGNISKSCKIAGISRMLFYMHMHNPEFKADVNQAKAQYILKS